MSLNSAIKIVNNIIATNKYEKLSTLKIELEELLQKEIYQQTVKKFKTEIKIFKFIKRFLRNLGTNVRYEDIFVKNHNTRS